MTSTSTPTAPPSVTPSLSPTPEPKGHVEALTILQGPGKEINVVGILRNISDQPWTDIVILVAIWDTENQLVDHQTVSPLLKNLGQNETGLFVAKFENINSVESASAEVLDISPTTFDRASVQVTVLKTIPTGEGKPAILGTITNSNS
ncbi:MAG: hypothetical protein GTO14_16210, partial [Anaerolineales bacterium]|nr:hypothetical protein [Anaerolineales bacterium]